MVVSYKEFTAMLLDELGHEFSVLEKSVRRTAVEHIRHTCEILFVAGH